MIIKPITFREASDYINKHHRHNKVCGRPISRRLDDGITCEINRVCTDGYRNACSKLYGACVRVAKEMGYKRVITYTLESEDGASLKASNFICDGEAGKTHWTGERNK